MWLKESGCRETIKAAWLSPLPQSNSPLMHERIKLCGVKLMEWSKHSFGSIRKQLEDKSKLLERADFAAAQGADNEAMKILRMEVAEIDNLFLPEEAAIIKAIPLSVFDRDDLLFWLYTHNGSYSVKLGYRLSMEQEVTVLSGTSNGGANSNDWKAIWSMGVRNRVRTLVWQVGTNSLPTKVNLVHWKILTEDVCTECKAQPEDVMHALWTCLNLKDMWKVQFSRLMADTGSCSSFLEILEQALKDKSSFKQFAMTISEVWQRRNRVRMGEAVLPLHALPHKAYDALQEFQNLRPAHLDIPRIAHAVKWKPPNAPCVKVNFNIALFSQAELVGIGVIIRNDQGLAMAALSQQIPSPALVEMVEVIVARRALMFKIFRPEPFIES
nr:putative ribonuclease h protein [Quercus suber]